MRLPLLTTTSLLASLAAANPNPEPEPEPQTQSPSQTSAAQAALSSYARSLVDSPALTSIASHVTDPALLTTLLAWESSVTSLLLNSQMPASGFLDALPTDAGLRSFYSSVYVAQTSILAENGFPVTLQPSSSTGGVVGAKETGVMKIGAVLAGAVGVVMAL